MRQRVSYGPLLSDGGCGRVIVTRHYHDDLDGDCIQIQFVVFKERSLLRPMWD
jgi:hypothetical protein